MNWQTGAGALENFTARGINTAINGYIPNLDLFPVRYAADGKTKIYPFTNTNTTSGRRAIRNPLWYTVAKGGLAVYEEFYILCRDIYEVRPRPIGPTQFGMAAFNPINYVGDLNWINNKDMDKNTLGNKGFFRMDIQCAAKPTHPNLGYTGITFALD